MIPKTITLRRKFNLGNFEMEDIEITMELEEGDDLDEIFQLVKQKIIYLHSIDCKEVSKKMDVTNYTKATGIFLKAKDLINNPEAVFVITAEGEFVTSEKFHVERLHLAGEFNKEPKTFDCSKTNARFVEGKFGKDTKTWIGKILVLESYRTKTSDGKMVDAINVKEAKDAQ